MSTRIDNSALREAFERSRMSATSVAREVHERIGRCSDSTTLRRSLGLAPNVYAYKGQRRETIITKIDEDLALAIAEVIGAAPFEIGL